MKCKECGTESPPQARFCMQCGTSLVQSRPSTVDSRPTSPRSLASNPLSYTPRHLAEKILSSRTALEGERKQVTVLFADVKGSMELAEQVDAEEWHRIMERFFAILTETVHRFEGTVNQYTGDGIMALFGAPIAHEDHAQRACYTALTLREQLRRYADALRLSHGLNFSVRMGLNSGEVVVGRIGDDLRMDYTAHGHTVGLAARMEALAEPGSVFVTEHTAKLVTGYVDLRDLGRARVKGVSEPLHVFELRGMGPLRTRLDRARAHGFSTFVGRDEELGALSAALERAFAGDGQIIAVVGEAGVGKSRLCAEFATRSRARRLSVYEAHCPSYGRTVPFLPVLALFRDYFGIEEHDSDAAAREKIAGRLLVRDDAARELLPVLFDFLGVADPAAPVPRMDPEARQRQLFALMRRLAEEHRAGGLGLILIDDLHWIDPGSEVFVTQLVAATPGTHTLLLVNFRPDEYDAEWLQRPEVRRIDLAPLGDAAISALLDELLSPEPHLTELRELIRARTGGNPFFIEELVQALHEQGVLVREGDTLRVVRSVTEIEMPGGVHALLAARIDHLAEEEKRVLQTAAVIGKEFTERVLARVVDAVQERGEPPPDIVASLATLMAAGFVYEKETHPLRRFAFRHPLTQEVAYQSPLTERRRRVHRAVAEVLHDLHAERADEVAALLSHHWEHAGEPLEAARWSRRAAEWSAASDMAEAVRHWQRVRTLVHALPEESETPELGVWAAVRLLNFGWRLGMSESEAAELFAEGQRLAARRGSLSGLAGVHSTYGVVRGMRGDLAAALDLTREGVRLADQSGDDGLKAAARIAVLNAQIIAGEHRAALRTADETLPLLHGDPALGANRTGFSPHTHVVMMRGYLLIFFGKLREATDELRDAMRVASEQHDIELLGWGYEFRSHLEDFRGDPDAATMHARRALEIAERVGTPLSRASAAYSLGLACLSTKDFSTAAAALGEGLSIIRERRIGLHWEARMLACLAEVLENTGEHELARRTVEEGRAARRRRDSFDGCVLDLAQARIALRQEGAAAREVIETALADALATIDQTGVHAYAPLVYEERANLAAALGDHTGWERELQTARARFAENGADGHVTRVSESLEARG